MLSWRKLLSFSDGKSEVDVWCASAEQDGPAPEAPKACAACPLRRGGEWEEGAAAAAAAATPGQRKRLAGWRCHAEWERACAGMRRIVRSAGDEKVVVGWSWSRTKGTEERVETLTVPELREQLAALPELLFTGRRHERAMSLLKSKGLARYDAPRRRWVRTPEGDGVISG